MHAIEAFELVLTMLCFVLALHWLALKLRLPPATVLLVGGGGLAFVPGLPEISLDPELALVLFLPPLLVDGAFYTALGRFRRNLPGIFSLAIGAVVFTTLVVGVVVHWLVPSLPWAACFALGAIVSPPDAVSARAVLKGVPLPRRLTTLLEGESLLNDATGLILFRFAVAATLSGTFHAGEAVGQFAFVAIGGALVGIAMGALWLVAVKWLNDRMLVIAATVILCWLSYLAAEALHVSGVIATVVAGLVQGWFQHTVLPAWARLQGRSVAELINFVLEAFVFILIGFSLRGALERIGGIGAIPQSMWLAITGVIVAVAFARFLWVFGSDAILMALRGTGWNRPRPLGWRQATILSWAGMRGVVTLAIPLTLPAEMPGRDLMVICAFGVIFASVILQGTSLGLLIRIVKPMDAEPDPAVLMPEAEACISNARAIEMERLAYDEEGKLIHPMLLKQHQNRNEMIQRYALRATEIQDDLYESFTVALQAHAAGRAELIRLHRAGLIEDEVLHNLERDLDVEEMTLLFQRGG